MSWRTATKASRDQFDVDDNSIDSSAASKYCTAVAINGNSTGYSATRTFSSASSLTMRTRRVDALVDARRAVGRAVEAKVADEEVAMCWCCRGEKPGGVTKAVAEPRRRASNGIMLALPGAMLPCIFLVSGGILMLYYSKSGGSCVVWR